MRFPPVGLRARSSREKAVTEPGVLLAEIPFRNHHLKDIEGLFDRTEGGESSPIAPRCKAAGGHAALRQRTTCLRHFLSETEGTGYWDYFRPASHFLLSVAEVTYRHDKWIPLENDRVFKLRLLLSGTLLDRHKRPLLAGPQVLVQLPPYREADGYFMAAGSAVKLVVLHCHTDVLTETLGLEPANVPAPLGEMFEESGSGGLKFISAGATAFQTAQQIIGSRHEVPSALRATYLESMARAVLCEVLSALSNQQLMRESCSRLSARDVNRIYEVRDYLAQHLQAQVTIPQLARMVGMNQTKLKQGFRACVGVTIHKFLLQKRMERAARLLATRNHYVAEIAYAVGYQYPSNFSAAFKRHFGRLPRSEQQPSPARDADSRESA